MACHVVKNNQSGSEKIALKWKSSTEYINILILKISFCSAQYANERYTKLYSNNALILLRIRPRINHFPLLITSKGFCKQCIQMS